MLNIKSGLSISVISGGYNDGRIIYIDQNKNDGDDMIELDDRDESFMIPLMNFKDRGVYYIAGPSGSGKSTYAAKLINYYMGVFPNAELYLFSRTNYKNDPAFKGMKINQININNLLEDPIDIEKEFKDSRTVLFFDDCNTIQDDRIKQYLEKLMADVMEIGRKLQINIIITNHLIIPNERKFARTIMNEIQYLTVFPKGSYQQISHVLKTYFGLSKRQINYIYNLPTRWVTIHKNYPMFVVYEKGAFTL